MRPQKEQSNPNAARPNTFNQYALQSRIHIFTLRNKTSKRSLLLHIPLALRMGLGKLGGANFLPNFFEVSYM